MARRKAMEVFAGKECEVSRLTYRGAHGIVSFMVAPDGTQSNSNSELQILKVRQHYLNWLNKHSGLFDFLYVEIPCKKPVTDFPVGREPFSALDDNDQKIVHAIVSVLNKMFDPDPTIDVEDPLDVNLSQELDLESKDYAEVLNELGEALSIKLESKHAGKPFESVRDLLHLVHLTNDPTTPRRRRRRA